MSQTVSNGGNTNLRSRRWCFTWNNYSEEDLSHCLDYVKSHKVLYCIGEEVGEEKQTQHLQGYFEFPNQARLTTLRGAFPKVHWEKARGNREQNRAYCSKGGKVHCNLPVPEKELCLQLYDNVVWKPWQNDVINRCATEPDDRSINWYWESDGNQGKSFLCKYLALKENAVVCDGKASDIFNQILVQYQQDDRSIRVICLDVPRHSVDYINYGMLEKIKNGFIYSGKYEGGKVFFRSPHVFVFANVEPDYSKWSADRFNVIKIC